MRNLQHVLGYEDWKASNFWGGGGAWCLYFTEVVVHALASRVLVLLIWSSC